jgi:ubiquitin C-terminal hydrolase
MLIVIARLLSTPAAHDITELCELRNLLLVGVMPPQLKFINPKQFGPNQQLGSHVSSEGFFADYGVPVVAYMGQKMLTFWPDEWHKALGGIKAIGHFVEWYHTGTMDDLVLAEEGSDKSASQPEVTAAGESPRAKNKELTETMAPTWLVGRVVSYQRDTGEHVIQLEPVNHNTASAAQRKQAEFNGTPESFASSYAASSVESTPVPSPVPVAVHCKVNLSRTKHHWVDAEYRSRIPLHPLPSAQGPSGTAAGASLLEYAHTDVGLFTRIWWSRYQKYFYGRIIRYDPVDKMHSVIYEDGDTRPYDMTTKDYDIITPPPEVLAAVGGGNAETQSDVALSKAVATWHRKLPEDGNSGLAPLEGEAKPFRYTYITRPAAATALNVSIYQMAVLDEYFREGGADAIFQSLTDVSQSPPVSRVILLHLQLVYQIRSVIGADKFRDLAWELKESIPFALFRYEDAHFKELSAKNLNDILAILKDMVQIALTGNQYQLNNNLRETMDEVRLTIGSALLVCSQLQKRYLGLSMIRDTLEVLLPKLDAYLTRRYNAIGVPRAAKPLNVRPVTGAASNSRITTAYMDKWLLDNGVLESLFGESLHQDLAAKSDAILVYMGSRKILTEKHIHLIWSASLGVHEAVVRVIHQLLILIVPVLGSALRNYLFALISALPFKEYTEQILLLIKAFTVQALSCTKEDEKNASGSSGAASSSSTVDGASKKSQAPAAAPRQWMGFTVLWQFVQDPVGEPGGGNGGAAKAQEGVDEGLIDLAIQLLVDLQQEEFKDERELVMQRCLDNIQAGRSVPVSLRILRRTLALYPQSPKAWSVLSRPSGPKVVTVGQQVEKLIKNSQLLDILFRDLDAYHRSIASSEYVNSAGLTKSPSGANIGKIAAKFGRAATPVPVATQGTQGTLVTASTGKNPNQGRVSQLKGVSERLDFLRFIISWSSVKLNEAQTMLLWNAFGEGASTIEALEKLFVWFNVLVNQESKQLSAVLSFFAQESDPAEPEQRSRLALLSPQILALTQQQGFPLLTGPNSAQIIALLSGGADADSLAPAGGAAGTTTAEGHATFEEGVLVKLFEEHILPWAFQHEKAETLSRMLVANVCFKLFLHANICNKALKAEADGSWTRVGQLTGLPLLWRIALDSSDAEVAHTAMALIVELHHKTMNKTAKPGEGYKANLLRMCFMHLYLSMQSLQLEDSGGASAISDETPVQSSQSAVAKKGAAAPTSEVSLAQDEWFHDNDVLMKPSVIAARIERLIVALRLAIHRFYLTPAPLHTIKVLIGREDTPAFTVVLRSTDKIGLLRLKIAEHFKENIDSIQILKTGKTSSLIGLGGASQEMLEKDEQTLVQAKLNVQDSVKAQKKDAPVGDIGMPPGSMQSAKPTRTSDMKDIFTPQDLTVNLLKPLNPLQWVCADSENWSVGDRAGPQLASEDTAPSAYDLFVIPPFPLVSVIESKLARCGVASVEESGVVSTKAAIAGTRDSPLPFPAASAVASAVAERKAKVLEFLTPIVRAAPYYIDQLLEVLDGYLSAEHATDGGTELSAAVWDILLSLPTHVQMTQQLRNIVSVVDGSTSALARVLSPNCPYRLLYSLQILESFVAGTTEKGAAVTSLPIHLPSSKTSATGSSYSQGAGADWTVQFFHIGGVEYILQLTETFLAKEIARDATSRSATSHASRSAVYEGMPRKDVNVMIISLLTRVLYQMLMTDPMFRCWQSTNAGAYADIKSAGQSEGIPEGVILSSVDVAGLTKKILQCSLHAADLLRSNLLTEVALKALCENALMLVFGLLNSVDDGMESLQAGDVFKKWVYALCVKCPSTLVRQAACRRLFEVSANIFHKCADPGVSQEQKRSRMRLCDFIYQEIVSAVDVAVDSTAALSAMSSSAGKVRHGEQIYTLLAAVESLRNSPYLIFPQISSPRVMRSSAGIRTQDSPRAPRDCPPSPGKLPPGDPEHTHALIALFVGKLVHHSSAESFHSAKPDGTLLGILRVLLVFANSAEDKRSLLGELEVYQDNGATVRLIPYLYANCLFPSPVSLPGGECSPTAATAVTTTVVEAVCQTQASRRLAYALLYRLCESSPGNLAQLVDVGGADIVDSPTGDVGEGAAENAEDDERGTSDVVVKALPVWNYDPAMLVKEPDAYVGLCNQGGTCYMNSFVQQLFHIPAFKQGLLRINAAGKGNAESSELKDENARLLFQLQVMFGFMKFSQKRYYDTLPFCREFLDYDGEPISLTEQKDINEFAGMLFDKLEHNPEAAALLANTILGKIVYRTRSIETPYRSEREEKFYMLTAEVKDKATLEDSLELFTADELFSGDNKIEDSDTGRKVDALRGCSIRALPSTLIIHLKRFEFDLETMNRKKVNDLISFPTDLNMFPYTEEGVQAKEEKLRAGGAVSPAASDVSVEDGPEPTEEPRPAPPAEAERKERKADSYYQYSLKGIVAHVGAIDRGHYYSFIKDREGGSAGGWLEFNDRSVLPFNPDAIPSECFGGKDEYVNSSGVASTRARENNAYLLVYERTSDMVSVSRADEPSYRSRSETADDISALPRQAVRSGSIDETTPRRGVSRQVMKAVSKENAEFQRDRFLFHPLHFAFTWQLQQMQAVNLLLESLKAKTVGTGGTERYIYDGGDAEADKLSLTVPSRGTDRSGALKGLVLVSVRFIVEVLVRARAQACVHQFIERLEDIVMQDCTGQCALAILEVFGSSAPGAAPAPATREAAEGNNPASQSGTYTSHARGKVLGDMQHLEKICHPWLMQMIVYCPHAQTVKSFLRLLLTCIKAAKAAAAAQDTLAVKASTAPPSASAGTRALAALPGVLSNLVEKVMMIVEKPQLDYLGVREGFELKCVFLYQFAQLGMEEKQLLARLEAIPR